MVFFGSFLTKKENKELKNGHFLKSNKSRLEKNYQEQRKTKRKKKS